MNKQSSNFVGSIPEYYDRMLGPRIFADFALDLAGRVAGAGPASVLELAAGTGIVSRALRDGLPRDCSLLATDLNPPMLELARQKFQPEENVRFEQADATLLPFKDESFDVVACQFGVMFFPDKQRSYSEVARVLKPGGRYVFNVWESLEHNAFAKIAQEVVSEFFPDDPPGFYRVPFSYYDVANITGSLEAAGFSGVNAVAVDVVSRIPSAADFATGLVFGNPLLEEVNDRGGDPQALCLALGDALDQKLGPTMSLRAIVLDACK